MKSPEMGMGTPEQEKQEPEKEILKEQIKKLIQGDLGEINIGAYTANKEYDGGVGEDLFDEPGNLEEILDEIEKKIDLSLAENWTKEKFIQELSTMKLIFDFSSYKDYDDFIAFREVEENLEDFTDIEYIADMLYNE